MGRRVSNLYGKTANPDVMTLEIVSGGLYALEVEFYAKFYDGISKLNWCYEEGKGLVYATDLTGQIPSAMGYRTGRVYLWAYMLHLAGYKKDEVIWFREHLSDYKLDEKKLRRQNNT